VTGQENRNIAKPCVVVVGSTNTDLTVVVDRLPSPGETVLGGRLLQAGGGKGANQAVAAARAGARVTFVGRVGDDDFGRAQRQALTNEGILTDHLTVDEQSASGVALILVDQGGENLIAVASGANGRLAPQDVQRAARAFSDADLVLLQLEIPIQTVRAAVQTAAEAGVPVLLNPAPAPPPGALDDLLSSVRCLTPNEGEAARLLGLSAPTEPEEMARRLVEAGAQAVVLTLGARGACVCEGGECRRVSAPPVKAVDTVGAGDCFSGVLAVALSEGMALAEAVRFATCAAALSVQVAGAQPSMPRRQQIEQLFNRPAGN